MVSLDGIALFRAGTASWLSQIDWGDVIQFGSDMEQRMSAAPARWKYGKSTGGRGKEVLEVSERERSF